MAEAAPSLQTYRFPGSGVKAYAGLGAFALQSFDAGDVVCDLHGRPSWTPPGNSAVEQAYITQLPGTGAPYLDQRDTVTPDAMVHTVTRRADANVVLDGRARCYRAVRPIAAGQELLMLGSRLGSSAMLFHQASRLTPPGALSTAALRVKRSYVAGLGCFAKLPIAAGQLVGAYLGVRTELADAKAVPGSYEFFMDQGADSYVIDGENTLTSSILRFVNHTDDPAEQNVSFERVDGCGIVAVTVQSVPAGAELLANYGDQSAEVLASEAQRTAMLEEANARERKRKQEESDRELAFQLGGVRRTRARW